MYVSQVAGFPMKRHSLYPSVFLTRKTPVQLWYGEKLRVFFLIPRNTENILHLNFRRKICSVLGSPDWPCPLINDKITLLISTEQIQPPTLLGLCSGQEVVFLPGQISFSCLNLVRSQGTKSMALIQSALKGKQLSKGTQVTAGDRRWNSMIIFRRTSRLWSSVKLLWHYPRSSSSNPVWCQAVTVIRIWRAILFLKQKNKWKCSHPSYLVKYILS